jgi:hypothetical protein
MDWQFSKETSQVKLIQSELDKRRQHYYTRVVIKAHESRY